MKTKKITVYYSIKDAGDGSAYMDIMESERLAEFDQEWTREYYGEGWAEPCNGEMTINLKDKAEVDSIDDLVTKEKYYYRTFINTHNDFTANNERAKSFRQFYYMFIRDFFDNKPPVFEVRNLVDVYTSSGGLKQGQLYHDGKLVKHFYTRCKDEKHAEEEINSMTTEIMRHITNDDMDDDYYY